MSKLLAGFGYNVPVRVICLWPKKDGRQKVERWLEYRTRKEKRGGRPSQRPAFLERYAWEASLVQKFALKKVSLLKREPRHETLSSDRSNGNSQTGPKLPKSASK